MINIAKQKKQKRQAGVRKSSTRRAAADKAGKKGSKPKKEPKPIKTVHFLEGMHLVESAEEVPDWITAQTGKIPPGWRFVQVADDAGADRLVCGYDYKGRLQTRYSLKYEQARAEEKFRRVEDLEDHKARVMDGIRAISNDDVRDCLLLIFATGLRPGSAKSAEDGHYGATTLLAEHVTVKKSRVFLHFTGKEGVIQDHEILDPELRRMLKRRKREAAAQEDTRLFRTSPDTLNRQLKAATRDFETSVKDLRTMKAYDTAYGLLEKAQPAMTAKEFAELRNRIGDEVCAILGNGRDMALESYIDPQLFITHSPVGYQKWLKAKSKEQGKKPAKPQ